MYRCHIFILTSKNIAVGGHTKSKLTQKQNNKQIYHSYTASCLAVFNSGGGSVLCCFFTEKVSKSVWGHPDTIAFEVVITEKCLAASDTSPIHAGKEYHSVNPIVLITETYFIHWQEILDWQK